MKVRAAVLRPREAGLWPVQNGTFPSRGHGLGLHLAVSIWLQVEGRLYWGGVDGGHPVGGRESDRTQESH